MIAADRPRFAGLVTGTADYYGKALSDFSIDLYWDGLRQFDIGAIETSIKRHINRPDKDGSFMPKVSDLKVMLEGRSGDQSALAWAKVDRAVRTVGTYEDVLFDDGLIHRIVDELGGWVWLGAQEEKNWPFIAKDFQARYQGYRMRSEAPEYVGVLTGIANSQNSSVGMRQRAPVLVGDPDACRTVLALAGGAPMIGINRAGALAAPQIKQISQGPR